MLHTDAINSIDNNLQKFIHLMYAVCPNILYKKNAI